MPRHPFKKYSSGERLSGVPKEILNAVVEQQRGVGSESSNLKGLLRQSGIVRVKNESGSAKDQYDVLGLDGPIITPTQNEREFKREVTFSGITPTTASHTSKFCILQEPLGINAIGKAVVAGVTQVRLTGADVGWATVTNSDATKLTASATGTVEVLWADSGSSERWAVVVLHSRNDTTGAGSTFSGVHLYRTSQQTISSGASSVFGPVTWEAELYDTDSYCSAPDTNITIPSTGKYLVTACLGALTNGTSTGTVTAYIAVNGSANTTYGGTAPRNANVNTLANLSAVIEYTSGTSLEVYVYNSDQNTVTISNSAPYSFFSVTRMG